MGQNNFAYALANGTVGVYEGNQRLWRIKVLYLPLMERFLRKYKHLYCVYSVKAFRTRTECV